MGIWNNLLRKRANNWIFAELTPQQLPGGPVAEQIEPNEKYLDIFLRYGRIVYVRKGVSKFYGTVHSFISLGHAGKGKAMFHTVTTPANLKQANEKNLDQVISVNNRLLGPVPYIGGDLEVELGLLSIKSADLAAPFLKVLEAMATAAGVTYINVALPFVKPITEGINLLAGAEGSNTLEIGLATTIQQPKTATFLVVSAEKGSVPIDEWKVDKDYHLLDENGKDVKDFSYMVFSIQASPRRDNWHRISELAAAHETLKDFVRAGNVNGAKEAFGVFRRAVITSPDLLNTDAKKIVDEVKEEMEDALQAELTGAKPERKFRDLAEIDIYGDESVNPSR